MYTVVSREVSVRLSVRPSVKRVNCDKIEKNLLEKSVQIFIPYEITFSLVFWEKMVGWGDPST